MLVFRLNILIRHITIAILIPSVVYVISKLMKIDYERIGSNQLMGLSTEVDIYSTVNGPVERQKPICFLTDVLSRYFPPCMGTRDTGLSTLGGGL